MKTAALARTVPHERIHGAAKEPRNWLTYSGGHNGQRHSTPVSLKEQI